MRLKCNRFQAGLVPIARGYGPLRIGLDYERAHPSPSRKQSDRTSNAGAPDAAFAKRNDDAMPQKAAY